MHTLIILIALIFLPSCLISQEYKGPLILSDTLKQFDIDGSLSRMFFTNKDSSLTEIRFKHNSKNYHGIMYRYGNDTITKFQSYHCNGSLFEDGEKNSSTTIARINTILSPEGKNLPKGNFDHKSGKGQRYSYRFYNCEILNAEIETYKDGKLDGPSYNLTRLNGDTVSVSHYSQGILSGVFKKFINGQVYQQLNYSHGKINGEVNYFNRKGRVIFTENYHHGELVSQKEPSRMRYELVTIVDELCRKISNSTSALESDSTLFNEITQQYFVAPPSIYSYTFDKLSLLKTAIIEKKYDIALYKLVSDPIPIDFTYAYYCSTMSKGIQILNPANIVCVNYSRANYSNGFYFYFQEDDNRIISIIPLFAGDKIICFN